MSMQDAATGVALWRQVADGIERGIAEGRFAAGEKLPGEMEIAETYRVNRHTVRRALATLAERGLVRAERGSGTYVEAQRLAYPLRSRTRFSEIVGAGGHEPRGQLIAASDDVATRELARELGLKTGAPLVRIEALRLADRTPICVSTSWLSAERFPDAGRVFASVRSMTKLVAHYGIRDYRRSSTRITAAIADASDAARLDLALGRPVLVVDSTDVDPDGKPIVTKRSRFAAERVEFLVESD
ncbi:phosphonate metabolism transcriptional regulator PhnF [Bradyrhizobium sp. AUGA SZCCT0240]|uniref:phosphonate metabolism transcriptional regulator PhnF n=1 Tax=unclassified Bradyrhizobium TaxID=2631580 RepID=UPI001BA745AD|nr:MULTISPECIES: phosphonate metabolism transcriptional regulator PhnF [unclassified Bradyrhizobium]MBR1199426.1 phosphonate metabolism transcriptional regulator PhnF [Bradyrhizobium sp. AUGA SZCCT0158]MBR1243281.1 phosphonate metabolism transcriptional regulator PhnF [Bradyrhizobium sp. AUGA SZCCT0274]MBR1254771.1 phosphonate metabolism transcriptional regulator PhnF [Bradyrhizobium sp. AUGA SZCCT0240]